jgi:hypothetical protein
MLHVDIEEEERLIQQPSRGICPVSGRAEEEAWRHRWPKPLRLHSRLDKWLEKQWRRPSRALYQRQPHQQSG